MIETDEATELERLQAKKLADARHALRAYEEAWEAYLHAREQHGQGGLAVAGRLLDRATLPRQQIVIHAADPQARRPQRHRDARADQRGDHARCGRGEQRTGYEVDVTQHPASWSSAQYSAVAAWVDTSSRSSRANTTTRG